MNEFKNRVAIVTGASSGIGEATARALAAEGARVAVVARRGGKLLELAGVQQNILPIEADVSDPADLERIVAETTAAFGPCDLLVNNAAMLHIGAAVDTSVEQWDQLFAVNVRSVFALTRLVLPSMMERGRGAIVNVGSISGVIGPQKFPGFTAYCASKAAVISFTEALGGEVAEHGVRVNAVSPGSVDTAMIRQVDPSFTGNMSPAEVAETILFLLSERSRPMNGQNLHVYSS